MSMRGYGSSLPVVARVRLSHRPPYVHIDPPIVTGILKGYDQLLNLVLDEVEEDLQGT